MYVSKNRWHVSKISTVNLRKKISRLSCTRTVLQERLRLVHPMHQTPIWRYPTKPLQLASVGYFRASLLPHASVKAPNLRSNHPTDTFWQIQLDVLCQHGNVVPLVSLFSFCLHFVFNMPEQQTSQTSLEVDGKPTGECLQPDACTSAQTDRQPENIMQQMHNKKLQGKPDSQWHYESLMLTVRQSGHTALSYIPYFTMVQEMYPPNSPFHWEGFRPQ